MMIQRTKDATEINAVLNDPSVKPSIVVPGLDHLDIQPIVDDDRNVLLMSEGGGVLFCQSEPGIYEVHTNFLEGHRGRNALRASLAAYRWMFTRTDCMVLLTRVPALNEAANAFCRTVGATLEFTRKDAWPTENGKVDLNFYALRYDDWVRKTRDLIKSGRAFHRHLEEERQRLKHPVPMHPDEDCHDLHVGACAEMIYGGQPEKAVVLYNRWARFVGFDCYKPIYLVSKDPLLIDITQCVLMIEGDTFKVIKWR